MQSRVPSDPFHFDHHTHSDDRRYDDSDYYPFIDNAGDGGRPVEVHYHLDQKSVDPREWGPRSSHHKHHVEVVTFYAERRVLELGPAYNHAFKQVK